MADGDWPTWEEMEATRERLRHDDRVAVPDAFQVDLWDIDRRAREEMGICSCSDPMPVGVICFGCEKPLMPEA